MASEERRSLFNDGRSYCCPVPCTRRSSRRLSFTFLFACSYTISCTCTSARSDSFRTEYRIYHNTKKNMHLWSDEIKPEEMSVEDYEDWLAERGGLMAHYEIANSLLHGLMTLHCEGRIIGTLHPEELGIEDETHQVVFLRADGLMQLSSWHDETSARNTVEENLHVLPILQSLLFPWPLDENQETEIGDQENEEDDVSIDAYLTDELRTLLFPEISPERAPNLPISLAELSTACERAMQQLQCCPSCETWYFSNAGQTNECPTCGWPEESSAGARLCMQIQPTKPLFAANENSRGNAIDLPPHTWIFLTEIRNSTFVHSFRKQFP